MSSAKGMASGISTGTGQIRVGTPTSSSIERSCFLTGAYGWKGRRRNCREIPAALNLVATSRLSRGLIENAVPQVSGELELEYALPIQEVQEIVQRAYERFAPVG